MYTGLSCCIWQVNEIEEEKYIAFPIYSKLYLLKREPKIKNKRLSGFSLMGLRVKCSIKLSMRIIDMYHQKMEFTRYFISAFAAIKQ